MTSTDWVSPVASVFTNLTIQATHPPRSENRRETTASPPAPPISRQSPQHIATAGLGWGPKPPDLVDSQLPERHRLFNVTGNEAVQPTCQNHCAEVLNRVHFENRSCVSPQSGNVSVRGVSGPNSQTTVSKLDAV